jgi:hypothetical protein
MINQPCYFRQYCMLIHNISTIRSISPQLVHSNEIRGLNKLSEMSFNQPCTDSKWIWITVRSLIKFNAIVTSWLSRQELLKSVLSFQTNGFRNAIPACVLLKKSFRKGVVVRSVTKIPCYNTVKLTSLFLRSDTRHTHRENLVEVGGASRSPSREPGSGSCVQLYQ